MTTASTEGAAILHLLRVTIEAAAPLSLGFGDIIRVSRRRQQDGHIEEISDDVMALARDANGLPVIPGSTLQGVLRHAYETEHGAVDARALFGYACGTDGAAGRLIVGFAAVHDSTDRALCGLVTNSAAIRDDPVLTMLRRAEPLLRDHVALNAQHVADGRKKFDRRAVPAGTRFSMEFALWGTASAAATDKAELERIAALFACPTFRVGGAGRQGYGKVVLRRASYACPNLEDPAALRHLRKQPPSTPLSEAVLPGTPASTAAITLKVELTPINPWRIGRGALTLTEGTHGERRGDGTAPVIPDMDVRQGQDNGERGDRDALHIATILREPIIRWINGTAELRMPGVASPFDPESGEGVGFGVPGSAIKGPLAHRTLFHWNRGTNATIGMIDVASWLAATDAQRDKTLTLLNSPRPEALADLFGAAKERDDDTGRAGRIFVEDGVVRDVMAVQGVDHNALDRFSDGVRFLYTEEVLVGGTIETTITVMPPPGEGDWSPEVRNALLLALRDLCSGQLAIGAKSLGFCKGEISQWHGASDRVQSWQDAWNDLIGPSGRRIAA